MSHIRASQALGASIFFFCWNGLCALPYVVEYSIKLKLENGLERAKQQSIWCKELMVLDACRSRYTCTSTFEWFVSKIGVNNILASRSRCHFYACTTHRCTTYMLSFFHSFAERSPPRSLMHWKHAKYTSTCIWYMPECECKRHIETAESRKCTWKRKPKHCQRNEKKKEKNARWLAKRWRARARARSRTPRCQCT